jgi:glycosyltransferase involved in cell wall biosynthesis
LNIAIYYHPDAYSTNTQKLMGRNAAGESFLKGLFRHSTSESFWVYVHQIDDGNSFALKARNEGRNEPVKVFDINSIAAMSTPGVLYYPGPDIAHQAWLRKQHGQEQWSICGITHTTSSANAMDAITNLITSPLQPWDAIICTSTAVKDNVNRVLQAQVDYLKERLGIQKIVLPQLPVIPLGIHTDEFTYSPKQKQKSRKELNIDKDIMVVLYMGRLSFHAKAHPLAMYQALELSAQQTTQKIVLIECGWHANDYTKKAYASAAKKTCPSVKVINLDGRIKQNRDNAWASTDVFCSLADNIQETFGITPIEAMAAGVPVVVSDWDGYKDTVRDGIDGYRIPTIMPAEGLGGDLAYRHAASIDNYDMYCGNSCMFISVDVQAAAKAFTKLFKSSGLRTKLGHAGRKRSKELYDWSVIIPKYEKLWSELNQIRESSKQLTSSKTWPARLDPFDSFRSYPTRQLTTDLKLKRVETDAQAALKKLNEYQKLDMVNFSDYIMPDEKLLQKVFKQLEQETIVKDVINTFTKENQGMALRCLSFLLKLNLIKVVS